MELMAAEMLDPQSQWREDLRMGILASTVANCAPFRGKDAKTFKPDDFIPSFVPKKKQTAKEIMAQMRAWTLAHGGKVKTAVQDGH